MWLAQIPPQCRRATSIARELALLESIAGECAILAAYIYGLKTHSS